MNFSTCPTCAQPLPHDAPDGVCPACLLKRTFEDATPPPPEEEIQQLSVAFPQLVIEEMIGQGGMGRVYRAQQPHLNRTVALKVLSAERANDPEWLERFSREARALARLSHPHIVQVYDFGEKPVPHLLMEHIDGVNLRQAMQNGGLTTREALAIVPKLCDALHYAHEHGVLHRDIKPENILIDTEGRVKIVDFGLAKLRDESVLPFTPALLIMVKPQPPPSVSASARPPSACSSPASASASAATWNSRSPIPFPPKSIPRPSCGICWLCGGDHTRV